MISCSFVVLVPFDVVVRFFESWREEERARNSNFGRFTQTLVGKVILDCLAECKN